MGLRNRTTCSGERAEVHAITELFVRSVEKHGVDGAQDQCNYGPMTVWQQVKKTLGLRTEPEKITATLRLLRG